VFFVASWLVFPTTDRLSVGRTRRLQYEVLGADHTMITLRVIGD